MAEGQDHELPQFLQLCNLSHLRGALEDAGVEQLQDLRSYFNDLKEMCPDGYREEMAATLGCKKIELSRLITAIDKLSPKAAATHSPSTPPRPPLTPQTPREVVQQQKSQNALPIQTLDITSRSPPQSHSQRAPFVVSNSVGSIPSQTVRRTASEATTQRRSTSVRLPEPINIAEVNTEAVHRRHSLGREQPQELPPRLVIGTPTPQSAHRASSAASSSSAGSRTLSMHDIPTSLAVQVTAYPVLDPPRADPHSRGEDENEDDGEESDDDRPEDDVLPPPPPPGQPPPEELPSRLEPRAAVSKSRRICIADLDAVSRAQHSGDVKKQAKYRTKLWHSRFLLLHGNTLFRFKQQKDFREGSTKAAHTMQLNVTSLALPMGKGAFMVGNMAETWHLQTESSEEMHLWVNVINAHVFRLYADAYRIEPNSFTTTTFHTSQYYALSQSSTKMMGVRAFPALKGPRTGGSVAPDEVFEVIGISPAGVDPSSPDACFQLADDRGWVCQIHTENEPIIIPASGSEVEESRKFIVRPDLHHKLPLLLGPSLCAQRTGAYFIPGESFQACKRWVTEGVPAAVFLKVDLSDQDQHSGLIEAGSWVQVFKFDDVADQPLHELVIAEEEYNDATAPPPPPMF